MGTHSSCLPVLGTYVVEPSATPKAVHASGGRPVHVTPSLRQAATIGASPAEAALLDG